MRHLQGKHRPRAQQRGLSFISLVFIGALAVAAFAIGGQSVPVFLEYQAVRKAATKAAREGGTVAEIRANFDRAAQIDDIKSVRGSDLEITKRNDKVLIGYEYSREISLAGPAYLVYRFNDQVQ